MKALQNQYEEYKASNIKNRQEFNKLVDRRNILDAQIKFLNIEFTKTQESQIYIAEKIAKGEK